MNDESFPEYLALSTMRAIREGDLDPALLYAGAPCGRARHKLICNSVPKSGTYMLVEVAKRFGYADIGFHLNTTFLEQRTADEKTMHPRPMPAVFQAAGLQSGQCAPAHIEYSFALENYLLSRPDYRMLFIIRDPRDLVISWVDYVFSSASYRSTAWNAYAQDAGVAHHPTDEARIAGSIEGLLAMKLERYLPWINSPACLTLRFEDLFSELSQGVTGAAVSALSNYLEDGSIDLSDVIGSSRTASDRVNKVAVYKTRMNEAHLERLRQNDFQKLVLDFGYDAT